MQAVRSHVAFAARRARHLLAAARDGGEHAMLEGLIRSRQLPRRVLDMRQEANRIEGARLVWLRALDDSLARNIAGPVAANDESHRVERS